MSDQKTEKLAHEFRETIRHINELLGKVYYEGFKIRNIDYILEPVVESFDDFLLVLEGKKPYPPKSLDNRFNETGGLKRIMMDDPCFCESPLGRKISELMHKYDELTQEAE